MLLPKYKQKVKQTKPVTRTVSQWTQVATEELQDCFDSTDWDVFRDDNTDLNQYTDIVTHYISFCEDVCIPTRTITSFPNSKMWFNKDIQKKIIIKDKAYKKRFSDPTSYKLAKSALKLSIRTHKLNFKDKLESIFNSGDSKKMWSHIDLVTQYKPKSKSAVSDDVTLPDKLNHFYTRFDRENQTTPTPLPVDINSSPPLVITDHDVRCAFNCLQENKAAGPDNIKPRLLRRCSSQLAPVFSFIFNWSLETSSVPSCYKKSVIVPVPKKPSPSQLNDYRPVALTSVIMKCFEKIVLRFLQTLLPPDFDMFQFAYRANRSVDDAIALNIHEVLNHLETKNSYARILFVDYSSAFNTIVPQKLYHKLVYDLKFPLEICNWILDFLLYRPQVVKIGNMLSNSIVISTGTPQGCPISPKLYSIFTFDCKTDFSDSLIVKFADDTTLSGLITNIDESNYRNQVQNLVSWCDKNNLSLNVSKTKEIVRDFRTNKSFIQPLSIQGTDVDIVNSFRFLGTHINNKLTWDNHCQVTLRKARQRLYFLRKLKSIEVKQHVLINFYRAIIESILTFSITVWYDRASLNDLCKLQSVIRTSEKIIGTSLSSLESLYVSRLSKKTSKIMRDNCHPSFKYFEFLPSNRRLRCYKGNKRFVESFYPQAVKYFNGIRPNRM